jgi:hypothetical protein
MVISGMESNHHHGINTIISSDVITNKLNINNKNNNNNNKNINNKVQTTIKTIIETPKPTTIPIQTTISNPNIIQIESNNGDEMKHFDLALPKNSPAKLILSKLSNQSISSSKLITIANKKEKGEISISSLYISIYIVSIYSIYLSILSIDLSIYLYLYLSISLSIRSIRYAFHSYS